ncbi:MAG TPA: XylR family transcriptional regulator, partial [Bacteroidia bacterium]|nr:XylR family transcriptional regulator [Bacteroidia bacterium]
MKRKRNDEIALAVNVGITHLARVVRGIREYAEGHTQWRFLLSPETHYLSPTALEGWKGDGVIALANTEEDFRVLASLDCPVVNLSGAWERSAFPRVRPDYEEIGRMAARHLLERGYRRFGFYGVSNVWYSSVYERGFSDELRHRGHGCSVLQVPATLSEKARWDTGQGELELWLGTLRPPFAVMAAHDPRAAMVLRACERVGLSVPGDVAVVGVNNDTVTCESCRPPLTSIERNDHEIGLVAARWLDRLIRGNADLHSEKVVPPGRICERASTDHLAVDQPDLLAVLEFAKAHYHRPIGVAELVDACSRSRRWVEDAFVE